MMLRGSTEPMFPGAAWQILLNLTDEEQRALSLFFHKLTFEDMRTVLDTDDAETMDDLATALLGLDDALERAVTLTDDDKRALQRRKMRATA